MANVRLLVRMQSNVHPKCIRRLECFRTEIADEIPFTVVHKHVLYNCASEKERKKKDSITFSTAPPPSLTSFSVFYRILHTDTLVHRATPCELLVLGAMQTVDCTVRTQTHRNRHDNVSVRDGIAVIRPFWTSICISSPHTCTHVHGHGRTFGDTLAPLDCQRFANKPDIWLVFWKRNFVFIYDGDKRVWPVSSLNYRYGITGPLRHSNGMTSTFSSCTALALGNISGTQVSLGSILTSSKSGTISGGFATGTRDIDADDRSLFISDKAYDFRFAINSPASLAGFQSNSFNVAFDCWQFWRNVFMTHRLRKQSRQICCGNIVSFNCDLGRPVNVSINSLTLTNCRLPASTTVSWPNTPIICSLAGLGARRHRRQILWTRVTAGRSIHSNRIL